jgi:drug/metabolite transporter (DMT)-like permease
LVATAPIFTALLAIWVDHEERSEGLRLLGIVIGIAGVVALFGVDLSGSGSAVLGGLAIVLAGLGYAVGGFIVKHRFRGTQPIGVAAAVMVASTILLAPAAGLTAPGAAPALGPSAAVATLGILGTGIAFAIFYTLIGRVGPARSFIVAYLAPGFAVVYGGALLDERITAATVAGFVLVLGGCWLATRPTAVVTAGAPVAAPTSSPDLGTAGAPAPTGR